MKSHITRALLIVSAFVCLSATAHAQGFPWDIFKDRTIKEVISITKKAVRPDDSMFLATNQLESKMEVTFTGQSRPILKSRKNFILWWVGMLRADQKEYAELYEREYLYKEGDDEYWLPTETPITKYFDKELKPGDKMTLYLISIGAYRTGKDIDCVLLVEEYQKVKDNKDKAVDEQSRPPTANSKDSARARLEAQSQRSRASVPATLRQSQLQPLHPFALAAL